ncbi:MAG: ABC transporter ATP-binding protein [Thermoanaerobaculia bacterium]
MTSASVSAEDLSKSYPVFASPLQRLRSMIAPRSVVPHRIHALQDVSFALAKGESLGLIGENGAGKSTLLKLVAGVTRPTGGRIEVDGRVAAILELGTGFHPDFTGRQNIELNAAMLGLEPDEVRDRMPDIVAFAEIGDFIDRPVRQYSTGMSMRLGFAIATQVDPDILIVDEALAVGDGYFQKKCMDRILTFKQRGKSLLFCSHAMYYVSAFCERALWMRDGRPEALGETREVVQAYESYLLRREAGREEAERAEQSLQDPGAASALGGRITRVALSGGQLLGTERVFEPRAPFAVEIEWETESAARRFHLGIGIDLESGLTLASFSSRQDGLAPFVGATNYRAKLELPSLPLVKGIYRGTVFLLDEEALHIFDRRGLDEGFTVSGAEFSHGFLHADHRWVPGSVV